MKFRPTEFLNTPYRVSCYIKLYRKLFSFMRPIENNSLDTKYIPCKDGLFCTSKVVIKAKF